MKSKPENIQQLIRIQQPPKKVSIKFQSNFTETTHQYGHSHTNSNTFIDDNKKFHIFMYFISLWILWCLFQSWLTFSPLCCFNKVPIQKFSFWSIKLSISFSDKPSTLFKTSIIIKPRYLNARWGSLQLSKKSWTILQVRFYSLYGSFNFLIVVSIQYKIQNLVYYNFCSKLST